MRQQFTGINECRVTARLLADNANLFQTIDQILHLRDTISQPVQIHAVIQTYRQTLHRAAFQAAICREAFLYHAKGSAFGVHIKEAVVFHAQQAAHRHHRIFLGGHRQHIGIFVGFAGDLLDGPVFVFCFTLLDEIGVFGKACGVHDHRNIVFLRDAVHRF